MTVRSLSHAVARLARPAPLVAVLIAGSSSTAHAQSLRTGGSMSVGLTILRPVATQEVRVTGFSVDQRGTVSLETTSPVSGPASQVVMTSVTSSEPGFVATRQTPVLVAATQLGAAAGESTSRIGYVMHVARRGPAAAGDQPVQLRIQYLAVAGT